MLLPPSRPRVGPYVTVRELLASCLLGTLTTTAIAWWSGWLLLPLSGPLLGAIALGKLRNRAWHAALDRYYQGWKDYSLQESRNGSAAED